MAVTTGNKISFIKTPVKYDIFNYKTFSYIKDSVIFHEPTSDIFLDGKLYSAPAKNMFIIPRSSELHEPYHVIWPKADSTQRYDCMRLEEWLLDGWGGEIFTDINKNNLIELNPDTPWLYIYYAQSGCTIVHNSKHRINPGSIYKISMYVWTLNAKNMLPGYNYIFNYTSDRHNNVGYEYQYKDPTSLIIYDYIATNEQQIYTYGNLQPIKPNQTCKVTVYIKYPEDAPVLDYGTVSLGFYGVDSPQSAFITNYLCEEVYNPVHAKISPKSFSWSEYNADNKLFMESTRTVLDVTFPNDATNNPTVSCIIPISMDESCPYKCIINKNIVEKIVFIPLDDEIYYANTPMGVLEYSKLTKKLSIGGTGIKSLQLIMDPKQSSVISGSFSFTSKKQIQEDIVHSKKIAVFNDGGGMVSQYNITNPTIFLPNIKICILGYNGVEPFIPEPYGNDANKYGPLRMHAGNRIYFQALNGYYFTKLIITKTIGIPVVVNQMELESTYCGTLTEDNVSTAVNFPSNLYISYVPIIITDNTTIMHISYELAQKGY